jgi:hypothetical protein
MTRTAADDAVMPACLRAAAARPVNSCPATAGPAIAVTAIAITGPVRRPSRLGPARPPFLRHRPGAPHQPEPRPVRPFRRRFPFPGNAVTLAGWPADPGRDL